MKTIMLFILFAVFGLTTYAQYNCYGTRYNDSLFDVTVTSDVLYGNNLLYTGVATDLHMDIYQPTGDTALMRPLIIFAPKGSFLQEDKAEWTMQQLCLKFAHMGYVTAAIDYRVGINYTLAFQNPNREFSLAVMRAYHDYKAAIRFFRKDAATTNTYKIDPNMIIAGGSSAGAITAVHVAYLDQLSEIPAVIDTTGLGGIEGHSGNSGYSSQVNYVVNLCGAIADTSWINSGNIPLISMHGNLDTEVPYGSAVISMVIPITEVDGSASINLRTNTVGIENPFHTFLGQAHIPYDPNAGGSYLLYMDTVINYVKTNLYNWICTSTGVTENNLLPFVQVYPNPMQNELNINLNNNICDGVSVYVYDVMGNICLVEELQNKETILSINNLPEGIYLIKIKTQTSVNTYKIIKSL
ncbi:MAG: T9SS type A sorting domain-containing protein [Bacteroidia bacterium]|nr:T9SS type A sorting domain-containing protein [Bacteroidia bacterium]